MYLKKAFVLLFIVISSISISQDVPMVKSDSLKQTLITPILETEIKPEQNLIYCATFQLAWNELRDSFTVHQSDDPVIIKELDKKIFIKDYLSEDCYVAMSGTWVNVVGKINKLLKEKFKEEAWLLTKERVLEDIFSESAFLAYAFLFKNLIFQEIFENLDEPILFNSHGENVEVESFGIKDYKPDKKRHQNLGKQVSIHYYNIDYKNLSREFIVELKSKSANEKIVIAQISPKKTLFETIKATQEIIARNKPDTLRKGETLQIPKLDFDVEHNFREIESYLSSLVNGPAKAYQRIKFRLDEKGAILKSEAIIVYVEELVTRSFIVSEPFLLYLKQKESSYPYFAMWIGNEEILIKTQ